jgi:hypothetical protein
MALTGMYFPGGLDLAGQLREAQPELVVGEGGSMFVIAKLRAAIDAFLGLAREP